jgi:flagellar basal-body rod protein FlgB
MFIDRLLNQTATPVVERMVQFTAARAEVLSENVVNASTPGYQQKDLSLPAFQRMLQERRELRSRSAPGSVGFDDLKGELLHPRSGVLFHDRNNRSMEQLSTAQASNALRHNMYTEMLKRQFSSLDNVLAERIA